MPKKIVVVRIRGRTGLRDDIEDTMELMKLGRVNHCVIVDDSPAYMGMISKCKDRVTWGEIDKDTLTMLIKKRALVTGNKKVSDADFSNGGFKSAEEFCEKFMKSESRLDAIKGIKPLFRLHPPRGGHRYIKKRFPAGALGYRGEKINELIRRMM